MTFTRTIAFRLISSLLILMTSAALVFAQSADANYPTPVHDKNLIGRIQARDLGDARLTNHYYAFHGTPGDLVITVQSRNLNGDIDVFTAGTLRPLLKLTLYAESTTPVTKGIYLRKTEDLVLRVQARTPNDEEGTYQLFFSGSFLPIAGSDIAEAATPATGAVPNRNGRRASSVGARIDEPPPPLTEVATVPALPDPTPAPTPVESPSPEVTEKPAEVAPASPAPARPAPRTARGRRPTTPTTRRTTTTSPKPTETPVETAKTEEPAATEPAPKPKPPARSTSSRGSTTTVASRPAEPKAEPKTEPKPEAAEIGPRLIIETNDGTLINQSMSRVKRVTIENGAVVVIGKNGKIDRILLANVVKMSIEPQ